MKLIHLGCFYRPPDHKVNPILELQSSLDKIVCQSAGLPSIVLLGDFNLPSIAWSDGHGQISSNPYYGIEINSLFLDLLCDIGLEQYVDSPTRHGKILDLTLSTNPNIHELQVVPGMSDHDAIVFNLLETYIPTQQHPHKVFLYHKANMERIKADLLIFQNDFLQSDLNSKCIEVMWNEFKQAIHSTISKHVPQRTIRPSSRLPWLSKQLKKKMKIRKHLYNTAKRTNSEDDLNAYRKLKNLIINEAHNNYCSRLFDNSFGGRKRQFWKYIRAKRKDTSEISTLIVDGIACTDTKAKAEALNNYFKSVFTQEDVTNIPNLENPATFEDPIPSMPEINFSLEESRNYYLIWIQVKLVARMEFLHSY